MGFNEYDGLCIYNAIKNKLRKYQTEVFVFKCIDRLMAENAHLLPNLGNYEPWYLALLIKWAIQESKYKFTTREEPSENDFIKIINKIKELGNCVDLCAENAPFTFLRSTAYQQFWWQRPPMGHHLCRQSLFFRYLESNHNFQRDFKKKVGLSIGNYLDLCFLSMAHFIIKKSRYFTESDITDSLVPSELRLSVPCYLNHISRSIEDLYNYLKPDSDKKIGQQYFENTSLKKFPLLKYNSRYYCISPVLFGHHFHTAIFDVLRDYNSEGFMDKFGRIFQSHVEKVIEYPNFEYYDENEIQKLVGKNSKMVDFIILSKNLNILVEAKGIEIAGKGMETEKSDLILDRIETSILKGIIQADSTLKNLPKKNSKFDKGSALIIVTYKNSFIGNGIQLDRLVGSENLKVRLDKMGFSKSIPLENMYFMPIEHFEGLIEFSKSNQISLCEIFGKVIKADTDLKTHKFGFELHLQDQGWKNTFPGFVAQEDSKMLNSLESLLNK